MKPNEIITTSDNKKIVVCNQWHVENIKNFINTSIKKGFKIDKID